jgi:hypothetical protein
LLPFFLICNLDLNDAVYEPTFIGDTMQNNALVKDKKRSEGRKKGRKKEDWEKKDDRR